MDRFHRKHLQHSDSRNEILIFTLQKVWSPAYFTEGSGKTCKQINNTPHPYDKAHAKCALSNKVMSAFVYPRLRKNLPDFQ